MPRRPREVARPGLTRLDHIANVDPRTRTRKRGPETERRRVEHGERNRHTVAVIEGQASRRAVALRVVLGTAITTTIIGLLAWVLHEPFVFPSLGPMTFLLFFTPMAAMSAPRNAIIGQAIGVGSGYLALVAFGLLQTPADLMDLTLIRVGAIVMALTLSFGLMIWWGFPHAPAGATAMIIALGILRTPLELSIMMLAVVTVVISAFIINRLTGIDMPAWSPRTPDGTSP